MCCKNLQQSNCWNGVHSSFTLGKFSNRSALLGGQHGIRGFVDFSSCCFFEFGSTLVVQRLHCVILSLCLLFYIKFPTCEINSLNSAVFIYLLLLFVLNKCYLIFNKMSLEVSMSKTFQRRAALPVQSKQPTAFLTQLPVPPRCLPEFRVSGEHSPKSIQLNFSLATFSSSIFGLGYLFLLIWVIVDQ